MEYANGLSSSEQQILKQEIETTLRQKLFFTADVQLVPEEALPRFEMKAKLIEIQG